MGERIPLWKPGSLAEKLQHTVRSKNLRMDQLKRSWRTVSFGTTTSLDPILRCDPKLPPGEVEPYLWNHPQVHHAGLHPNSNSWVMMGNELTWNQFKFWVVYCLLLVMCFVQSRSFSPGKWLIVWSDSGGIIRKVRSCCIEHSVPTCEVFAVTTGQQPLYCSFGH